MPAGTRDIGVWTAKSGWLGLTGAIDILEAVRLLTCHVQLSGLEREPLLGSVSDFR